MNAQEAIAFLGNSLKTKGFDSHKQEARTIIEHILSEPIHRVLLDNLSLSSEQEDLLEHILARRIKNQPLQYILAHADFFGLKIKVDKNVLIPRQETEVLVDYILRTASHKNTILDIGSGSGAVALALKANLPDSEIMATDISPKALSVARQNAKDLNLDIEFIQSDLLFNKCVRDFAKNADVVVANLPYLPESDKDKYELLAHEPELALFSGDFGLDHYFRLVDDLLSLVKDGALIGLELDPRNIIEAQAHANAWSSRKIMKDLLERERFLILVK